MSDQPDNFVELMDQVDATMQGIRAESKLYQNALGVLTADQEGRPLPEGVKLELLVVMDDGSFSPVPVDLDMLKDSDDKLQTAMTVAVNNHVKKMRVMSEEVIDIGQRMRALLGPNNVDASDSEENVS